MFDHLAEEDWTSCFTLIVFLLLCDCKRLCLMLVFQRVGMWSVIVAVPGHTHLLFENSVGLGSTLFSLLVCKYILVTVILQL